MLLCIVAVVTTQQEKNTMDKLAQAGTRCTDTIRMRCMLRGVSEDTTKNITSAYNFAQQYFGEA